MEIVNFYRYRVPRSVYRYAYPCFFLSIHLKLRVLRSMIISKRNVLVINIAVYRYLVPGAPVLLEPVYRYVLV